MADTLYALSLKQPWATLLVHKKKTIEIRSWSTKKRGRVLIHAARVPDARPEAWQHVTDELLDDTELRGGIIGYGEIREVKTYSSEEAFALEQSVHLNDLSWYKDGLHGFVFDNLGSLPFHKCSGNVRFFRVEGVTIE